MRLVTWNAGRGSYESKVPLVLGLNPDVAVIQEIAKPKCEVSNCCWFGDNPNQGVAVVAGGSYSIAPLPQHDDVPKFVVPFAISGPHSFVLMAVWTLGNQPMRYVRAASAAVKAYSYLFQAGPVVMLGDFNSNAIWDNHHPRDLNHSALVERLAQQGLVSAYHHTRNSPHGCEPDSTFHLYRHMDKPYHIDYCFVPAKWTNQIRSVEIGQYRDWSKYSDHLPLTVDIDSVVT